MIRLQPLQQAAVVVTGMARARRAGKAREEGGGSGAGSDMDE